MFLRDKTSEKNNHILTLDGGLDGKYVFNKYDCIGKGNFGKIFLGIFANTECAFRSRF